MTKAAGESHALSKRMRSLYHLLSIGEVLILAGPSFHVPMFCLQGRVEGGLGGMLLA